MGWQLFPRLVFWLASCSAGAYTISFVYFMHCLPYLALINSAAEVCGLGLAIPAIAPLAPLVPQLIVAYLVLQSILACAYFCWH